MSPLSSKDIYAGEPPAVLIMGRWRARPISAAFVALLFGSAYMGGLAAAFGYFLPREGIVASLADVFNQLNFIVIFPAVIFYYLWQPVRIARMYQTVFSYVGAPGTALEALVQEIKTIYARRRWWLSGVLVAVLAMAVGTYDNSLKLGQWWYAANWFMIAVLQIVRGVVFYAITIVLSRHLATTIALDRVFREVEIPVRIVTTRRAGGIQSVGEYAFTFIVFIAVLGLNLGAKALQLSLTDVAAPLDYVYQVILYFLLAPAAFVLPLWQVHQQMVKHRQTMLDDLAFRLQAEYEKLTAGLMGDAASIEASHDRLSAIKEAYELTREIPTWPFGASTIYRVIVTVIGPFIFSMAEIVLDFFAP